MNWPLLLLCTCCIILQTVYTASLHRPNMVTLADFTRLDMNELNYLENLVRNKRSDDLISGLKSKIGQGIKSKLGLLTKSSSPHYSTSYQEHHDHHYDLDDSYSKMSFDFWSLKKSIFNTLLQAAKAIKGGIIALKGQLIKGSGSLISAKGKIIRAKGEALSSIGKNIVSTATYSGHSGKGHSGHVIEYDHHHHPTSHSYDGYASHSAPGPEYGIPSSYYGKPSSGYLNNFHSYEDDHKLQHGDNSGILILKKIPSSSSTSSLYGHHHELESQHYDTHHDIPTSSHTSSKSSIKSLLGKLLSATAKASASASAHASSYAAHKAADAVSHLSKAAAAGSAASSAYLSTSKEPMYATHPSSPEAYEHDIHDAYHSYTDYSSINDNEHEGTQTHNAYAQQLLPTFAALKSPGPFPVTHSFNNEQQIDSYGNPIINFDNNNNQQLQQQVDTFKNDNSYGTDLQLDTVNMYSSAGLNENLAHYQTYPTDYTSPNMHLSLTPTDTSTNLQNPNGNLFFGVNFPLEASDPTAAINSNTNNFNTFSSTGLNQFESYPTSSVITNLNDNPIDFNPTNIDLSKLLGPSELTNNGDGVSFLPTPTSHYNEPDYNKHRYSPSSLLSSSSTSLRSTKKKRSPSLRVRRRRKTPVRVLKSVGYEIRRHRPITM